ncbi:glycosyltransferase family 2 protein [Sphingomonas montana]|uniref:glycosyltransferase family 2 protein n=1 Tax=Sphingomonas montana TaxID=1843236 RepID=UPI00096F3B8D|nr:glycosyltransferase family 2 protein [Sphingomonas montana]
MPSTRTDPNPAQTVVGRANIWLKIRMHLDAACLSPRAYLTAIWWRLRGKRLRARARLSPLLGQSPLAYRLWLANEAPVGSDHRPGPRIVALIDCRAGSDATSETLRSLDREGIGALCVGTAEIPDAAAASCAIVWTDDPWLMPLNAGDVLAAGTANAYRRAIANVAGPRVVYADDDLLDSAGRRDIPHFKPDWNAELFRYFDYLTGACIVRTSESALAQLSGPDWSAQLVASAAQGGTEPPVHVRRVLHHRQVRPVPRVPVRLEATAWAGALPTVTVIIPTRNRVDLLRTCLQGLSITDYPGIEVIVVDNDSDDPMTLDYLATLDPTRHRVLRHSGPFNFSAMNNRAARMADGDLLCLLNNDIAVIRPDWLAVMARQALRAEVGAVGARLLYPDGRIQHAGVVLGVGGGAAHAHRLLHPQDDGYFHRHSLPQFVSAVTAACLVVRRDRFMAVGGLDEVNFAVAFNDVDLCMRLNQRGWQSLYEPRATLFHHESVSRGFDRDPAGAARLAGELQALKAAWGTDGGVDPFHHPELSSFSERFVVRS